MRNTGIPAAVCSAVDPGYGCPGLSEIVPLQSSEGLVLPVLGSGRVFRELTFQWVKARRCFVSAIVSAKRCSRAPLAAVSAPLEGADPPRLPVLEPIALPIIRTFRRVCQFVASLTGNPGIALAKKSPAVEAACSES